MGEGAGANIVTRAACEERQRDIDAYNSLSKSPQTGGMLTGLILVQPDFDGPTVGQNLSAALGGWMMRRGWHGAAAQRFGVPECVNADPGYVSDFAMMDPSSVASFGEAYFTSDSRNGLGIRRTRTLKNLPNLVMVGEECAEAKERAADASRHLDAERGSGVVGVSGSLFLGHSYGAGGGALLKDRVARANVTEAVLLFCESC